MSINYDEFFENHYISHTEAICLPTGEYVLAYAHFYTINENLLVGNRSFNSKEKLNTIELDTLTLILMDFFSKCFHSQDENDNSKKHEYYKFAINYLHPLKKNIPLTTLAYIVFHKEDGNLQIYSLCDFYYNPEDIKDNKLIPFFQMFFHAILYCFLVG